MENICSEIIFLIFTKIDRLEDQINFALSCNYILMTFTSNSSRLNATLSTDSKYYTNILVNLINHYHYCPSKLKITNSSNLQYLTKQILLNYNFASVVLPTLTHLKPRTRKINFDHNTNTNSNLMIVEPEMINYDTQKIIDAYIETRKDRIDEIDYFYEFNINRDNCVNDYFYNNLDDDNSNDYNEIFQINSYDIPWYVTQINFTLDYCLVCNVSEINRINYPCALNDNCLNIYCSDSDYVMTHNCVNPKIDLDNWLLVLKSKYTQLKTIKISNRIINTDFKVKNKEIPFSVTTELLNAQSIPTIINYKFYCDPIFHYKLFEIGCIITFCTLIVLFTFLLCTFLTIINAMPF